MIGIIAEEFNYANKIIRVIDLFEGLCHSMDLPIPHIGVTYDFDDDVVTPEEVLLSCENMDSNADYYARSLFGKYVSHLGVTKEYSDVVSDLIASFVECCSLQK
jgi:hypothetical protein